MAGPRHRRHMRWLRAPKPLGAPLGQGWSAARSCFYSRRKRAVLQASRGPPRARMKQWAELNCHLVVAGGAATNNIRCCSRSVYMAAFLFSAVSFEISWWYTFYLFSLLWNVLIYNVFSLLWNFLIYNLFSLRWNVLIYILILMCIQVRQFLAKKSHEIFYNDVINDFASRKARKQRLWILSRLDKIKM